MIFGNLKNLAICLDNDILFTTLIYCIIYGKTLQQLDEIKIAMYFSTQKLASTLKQGDAFHLLNKFTVFVLFPQVMYKMLPIYLLFQPSLLVNTIL